MMLIGENEMLRSNLCYPLFLPWNAVLFLIAHMWFQDRYKKKWVLTLQVRFFFARDQCVTLL